MKTAEEWIKHSGGREMRQIADTGCIYPKHCICKRCKEGVEFFLLPEDIKQIQTDAIQEGMRRAAKICTKHGDKWRNGSSEGSGDVWTVIASDECAHAILAAAEELTKKE